MSRAHSSTPHARSDELVVTELGDEVLVYDKARDKAHCLNQTAALVWKYSNGKRTVSEIAAAMQNKLHSPVDEQIVWYALGQLEKDHLMEGRLPVPNELAGISRREFVKTMGKVAVAVTVPIVISLTAPRAALAVSCLADGTPCLSGTQCCSGNCGTAVGPARGPASVGVCIPT
ncbi:MAG TPA: PqqD family peptide modification chaperone [Anaerolineae bacterium]